MSIHGWLNSDNLCKAGHATSEASVQAQGWISGDPISSAATYSYLLVFPLGT